MIVSTFVPRRGKVREMRMMRERERERRGRNRDAFSMNAVPVLCATPPPPLPLGHEWSKWMMDPAHTNTPLLLRPSSPFTGMSEASTPTTTITTATQEAHAPIFHSYICMQSNRHTHTHTYGTDRRATLPTYHQEHLERVPENRAD